MKVVVVFASMSYFIKSFSEFSFNMWKHLHLICAGSPLIWTHLLFTEPYRRSFIITSWIPLKICIILAFGCRWCVTQRSPESPGSLSVSRSNIAVHWAGLSWTSQLERPACQRLSSVCTNGKHGEKLVGVARNHTSSPMLPLPLLLDRQAKLLT